MLLSPVASAFHWVQSTYVSLSPTQTKASRTVDFQVTVTNGGSTALTVCDVDISFRWEYATWRISSGTTVIPAGGGNTWTINEAIPALPAAFFSFTVSITAMTSGDLYCEKSDWSGDVQIVANAAPVSAFAFSPIAPDTNTLVQFTDESSDSDGQVVVWNWNFGDGSTANIESPTHQFLSPGIYHVALTVTDNEYSTNSVTQNIQVVAAPIGGGPRIAGLGVVEWGIVAVVIVAIAVLAVMLTRRRRKVTMIPPPPLQQPPMSPPPQ